MSGFHTALHTMSTGIAEGDAFEGMHVPGNKSAVSSQDVTTMMVLSNMHMIQGQQMEKIEALSKRLDRIEASTEMNQLANEQSALTNVVDQNSKQTQEMTRQFRTCMSTFNLLHHEMCDKFHGLQMQMVTCKLQSLLNVGVPVHKVHEMDPVDTDKASFEMIEMVQKSQLCSQDSKTCSLLGDLSFLNSNSNMEYMSDQDDKTRVYDDGYSLEQGDGGVAECVGSVASSSNIIHRGNDIDLYCHETLTSLHDEHANFAEGQVRDETCSEQPRYYKWRKLKQSSS